MHNLVGWKERREKESEQDEPAPSFGGDEVGERSSHPEAGGFGNREYLRLL